MPPGKSISNHELSDLYRFTASRCMVRQNLMESQDSEETWPPSESNSNLIANTNFSPICLYYIFMYVTALWTRNFPNHSVPVPLICKFIVNDLVSATPSNIYIPLYLLILSHNKGCARARLLTSSKLNIKMPLAEPLHCFFKEKPTHDSSFTF